MELVYVHPIQWNWFFAAFLSFSKKTSILLFIFFPMSLQQKHAMTPTQPNPREARAVISIPWIQLCCQAAAAAAAIFGVTPATAMTALEPRGSAANNGGTDDAGSPAAMAAPGTSFSARDFCELERMVE